MLNVTYNRSITKSKYPLTYYTASMEVFESNGPRHDGKIQFHFILTYRLMRQSFDRKANDI